MHTTPKLPPLQDLLNLVRQAGQAIMAIYHAPSPIQITYKDDTSPLTQADVAAHHCLAQGLAQLTPEWPLLSEETPAEALHNRHTWPTYWLIDPLDGTKEFIQRNGEFTVNVALIHQHRALLGVVYAPALAQLYWGQLVPTPSAYRQFGQGPVQAIHTRALPAAQTDWIILTSRSHPSAALQSWCARYPKAQQQPLGSSLKLCRIAEGEADFYPRYGPTSEWDTAAAQAILEAAGGQVCALDEHATPLGYNMQHQSLLNPHFIATGQAHWIDNRNPA